MRSSPEVQAVEQLTEGLEEEVLVGGYRAEGFAIMVSQGMGAFPGGGHGTSLGDVQITS